MLLKNPNTYFSVATQLVYISVFLLPFYYKTAHWPIFPALIFVLTAYVFFKGKIEWTKKNKYQKTLVYAVVAYVLIALIGIFLGNNNSIAFKIVSLKFTLLYLPLVYLLIPAKFFDFKLLGKYYLFGCFFSVLYCIFKVFIQEDFTWEVKQFTYLELAHHNHPSYLALSINTGIGYILYLKLNQQEKHSMFNYLLLFILSLFVVLLSSKAGIISLILIYLFAVLQWVLQKQKIKFKHIISSIIILILSFSLGAQFNIGERFNFKEAEMKVNSDANLEGLSSNASRIVIWKKSLNTWKKHFLLGVGTGDYYDSIYPNNPKKKLNAHNQFLQDAVENGLLGLLALTAGLLFLFLAIQLRFSLWAYLIIGIFTFNLLTESMLLRLNGILFLSTLIGLALVKNSNKTIAN